MRNDGGAGALEAIEDALASIGPGNRVHDRIGLIPRPRMLLGIPSGVTEVEKRAAGPVEAGAHSDVFGDLITLNVRLARRAQELDGRLAATMDRVRQRLAEKRSTSASRAPSKSNAPWWMTMTRSARASSNSRLSSIPSPKSAHRKKPPRGCVRQRRSRCAFRIASASRLCGGSAR